MQQPFISYYEHIAKLLRIANKQTLFLAHVLSRMEFNDETKLLYVDLPPMVRRDILKSIGVKSQKPLIAASQYISVLQKAGLIKSIGSSRYMVDPESYGYAKYVPKNLREKSSKIFSQHVFNIDNEGFTETWVEFETGEIEKL